MTQARTDWIYLDDEIERERLAQAMREIRQQMRQAAELRSGPQLESAYEAQFAGWSIAALLSHLNANDTLGRWQLQAALVGIRPQWDEGKLHRLNRWQQRFFQRTPLEKTFARIDAHCRQLCEFIHRLPLKKLSTPVWLVATQEWSTVERAAQIFFLHHWQEHLAQISAPSAAAQPIPPKSTASED
ncbi:MAG: hypothetical protein OXF22_00180 [Anaerolineaceae bacterium]|nr:hypothetical protein [Anaerolineaceae bacterium]